MVHELESNYLQESANKIIDKPREKGRLIFQVNEGHNSKQTAIKYQNNFNLFLNYIKIQDLGCSIRFR